MDYRKEKGELCPIVEILIGKEKNKIYAYADTGCTTGIYVFKEQVEGIDLGIKTNDEPSPCLVADGHMVGADEFVSMAYVNGERKEIIITVVDLENKMGSISIKEMPPLLGRNFLDDYDVLFKGKDRKIALFHPE